MWSCYINSTCPECGKKNKHYNCHAPENRKLYELLECKECKKVYLVTRKDKQHTKYYNTIKSGNGTVTGVYLINKDGTKTFGF